MKIHMIAFSLLASCANGVLFTPGTITMSRKTDNLPWPLLNPHSITILTTHGLHCLHALEAGVAADDLNWIDTLHLTHCRAEVQGVVDFLQQRPDFSVPHEMCPQISGTEKDFSVRPAFADFYKQGTVKRMNVIDMLNQDPLFEIYTNKSQHDRLYVDYSHSPATKKSQRAPALRSISKRKDPSSRLYVDYGHNPAAKKSQNGVAVGVIKTLMDTFISNEDVDLRTVAGYNYGAILLKNLLHQPLTASEAEYIAEQKKTVSEWSWAAASFTCTFGNPAATIKSLLSTLHKVDRVLDPPQKSIGQDAQ